MQYLARSRHLSCYAFQHMGGELEQLDLQRLVVALMVVVVVALMVPEAAAQQQPQAATQQQPWAVAQQRPMVA